MESNVSQERFGTGAVRDTQEGKPRPDLISPFFLWRLGEHLRKGAEHYGEWNWAKGIPSSRCYASLMRHLQQYAMGYTNEDHLAAAAFNIMAIIHNEEVTKQEATLNGPEVYRGLVDMPKFTKWYTEEELLSQEKIKETQEQLKRANANTKYMED